MVEVFKTNVDRVELSEVLIQQLLNHLPGSCINFDMEDCDKILRVEAKVIVTEKVIKILNANGYSCEALL